MTHIFLLFYHTGNFDIWKETIQSSSFRMGHLKEDGKSDTLTRSFLLSWALATLLSTLLALVSVSDAMYPLLLSSALRQHPKLVLRHLEMALILQFHRYIFQCTASQSIYQQVRKVSAVGTKGYFGFVLEACIRLEGQGIHVTNSRHLYNCALVLLVYHETPRPEISRSSLENHSTAGEPSPATHISWPPSAYLTLPNL